MKIGGRVTKLGGDDVVRIEGIVSIKGTRAGTNLEMWKGQGGFCKV